MKKRTFWTPDVLTVEQLSTLESWGFREKSPDKPMEIWKLNWRQLGRKKLFKALELSIYVWMMPSYLNVVIAPVNDGVHTFLVEARGDSWKVFRLSTSDFLKYAESNAHWEASSLLQAILYDWSNPLIQNLPFAEEIANGLTYSEVTDIVGWDWQSNE